MLSSLWLNCTVAILCIPILQAFAVFVGYLTKRKGLGESFIIALSKSGGWFEYLCIVLMFVLALGGKGISLTLISHATPYLPELIVNLSLMSLSFLLLTQTVFAIVTAFSVYYLHREQHYHKFFGLYFLFKFSINLLLITDNISWFLIGWEILGLTSVLLISFYSNREQTVKNSLRIFGFYKIGDVLLFFGFAIIIHFTGGFYFPTISQLSLGLQSAVGVLTVLAVMIKIGLLPVPWLPRAMEGPTVSSAIFYGCLATHVPLLFLLRILHGVEMSANSVYPLLVLLGILGFMTSMLSRVQVDAKNSQAYGALTQYAIIMMEILMGWSVLAFLHIATHSLYRVSLFLRTPSLLYEYNAITGYKGRAFARTGAQLEMIVPKQIRDFLYYATLREFFVIPRIYDFVDKVLILKTKSSARNNGIIILTNLSLWLGLIAAQSLMSQQIHIAMFLLFIPWILGVLSIVIQMSPVRYIFMMGLCSLSLILVLLFADHLMSLWVFVEVEFVIYITIVALLFLPIPPKSWKLPRFGPVSFALILWLVGVPGPGTFIVFDGLFHHLFSGDFFVAIGAFIIMSIFAFSVVRFYCMNNCQKISKENLYV